MRDRHRPKDLDGIRSEIDGMSARSAIIVASSYLECSLEDVIATRFRKQETAKERGILFSDTGILGTFSEKIWAAYFLRIIGKNAKHDMDLIRSIRNEVAHNANPVTFDLPEISDRCKKLRGSSSDFFRPETSTPRDHFVAVVDIYSMALDWIFIEGLKLGGDMYVHEEASEKSAQSPKFLDWLND